MVLLAVGTIKEQTHHLIVKPHRDIVKSILEVFASDLSSWLYLEYLNSFMSLLLLNQKKVKLVFLRPIKNAVIAFAVFALASYLNGSTVELIP